MRGRHPLIVAVILHWQRLAETLECLASLMNVRYPALEIVIVDNSGDSEAAATMAGRFPGATILRPAQNLGFAAGNNLGIQHALTRGAAYVLLLNNDTVVAPDLLWKLLLAWEGPSPVAAAGPTIYYFDRPDTIWSAGGAIDWRLGATRMLRLGQVDTQVEPGVHPVDFVTGCAMLMPREALDEVGLFDARFFAYYEETEWCVRAVRRGYGILHVPQARVWHRISPEQRSASPRVAYYMTRNRLLFLHRTRAGPVPWLSALAGELRTIASWSIRRRWREQRERRDAKLRGLADYFRGRLGRSEVYSP